MAIISHKYKFIFIKTTKTAGTAIEVTLSQLCGDSDILTPVFPSEPGHIARNYVSKHGNFYNHMTAKEILALLGTRRFASYFKFCVERDPIEKCLSHYAMLKNSCHHNKQTAKLTWDEYVNACHFPIDMEKYCDDQGNMMVDKIISYKHLHKELGATLLSLGVPWSGLKSNAKSGFRNSVLGLSDITASQRKIIQERFDENNKILNQYDPNF